MKLSLISAYTPGATDVGSLVITVPTGGDGILADTPIMLEIVSFAPTSVNTVST
ncbi:hypothetical protein [Bacillus sp. AFS002410]|uniref:hypothetical protein n=1 Tax=Bacillus sp. AFS002410 TaxID=2033481 RepID=UPI00211D66C8|nr:hypothetical protein [Bacillus sp. AFS002410]